MSTPLRYAHPARPVQHPRRGHAVRSRPHGQGIALEDLQGIRDRVRLRKPQRVTLHAWSFHQLGNFIAYKARRAGIAVVHVDPAYTSQECSACGHTGRANRPGQETFLCTSCGFAEHADVNAARNIAARGVAGWAVSHAA
jgi:IS605 OrfB family transposase